MLERFRAITMALVLGMNWYRGVIRDNRPQAEGSPTGPLPLLLGRAVPRQPRAQPPPVFEAEGGLGEGEGGSGKALRGRAAGGEVAVALTLVGEAPLQGQRDPGDEAPFRRDPRQFGQERRRVLTLALLDLEGQDEGGRQ